MSSVERLTAVSAPFLTVVSETKELASEALVWQDSGLLVRAVRGRKSRTIETMFDEFAAAFQFPYYFGENWAAFRDCISDLDWLPLKCGVALIVYGAGEVLADAHAAEMDTLVRTLMAAADDFAEVVNDGEWWDRGPVPFHVVLQGMRGGDFERWDAAGAALEPLA